MTYNTTEKGELLKQVRESKGIALRTVHEATKIPMDALRAIEEGYTVRTLSEFYYKGFLKMYAQYLGVEVTKVIDGYKKEEIPKPIKDQNYSGEDIKTMLSKFFTKEKKQFIGKIIAIALILFVFFKVVTFIKGFFSPRRGRQGVTQVDKRKKSRVKPSSRQVVKTASVERSKKLQEKAEVKSVMQDITLTVRAKKDSWLRVKADDVIVFQSTLTKGASETWIANDKIELSGNRINMLEFELNGKTIGSLGRADRRARKLIVTKEGLSVKK